MKIKLLVLGVLLCLFSGCMLFSSPKLTDLEMKGNLAVCSYNYQTDDEKNYSLKENNQNYKLIQIELKNILSKAHWRPTSITYVPNIVVENLDSSININFLSDHVLVLNYKKVGSKTSSQYICQLRDVNKNIIILLKDFIKQQQS